MHMPGHLRRLAILSVAALALAAGASQPASGFGGCPTYPIERPFLPWLDALTYALAPDGGLEDGGGVWSLSGGAKLVAGNETFFVRSAADEYSLSLPTGSSATTGTTCVETLEGTMRLFVQNTGSLLSTLKVEVLYTDMLGVPRVQTVALLPGTARWLPALPVAFLANLTHPPVLSDGKVSVAFRFTPLGKLGAWRIDDVYVDPFKGT